MKKFGVSPLTNTIYYGESKDLGDGKYMFVGKKEDVTDDVLRTVFQWFVNNVKDSVDFSITYDDSDYELEIKKKNKSF